MRKIFIGLMVGLLSVSAFSQDKSFNCDSTCLVPFVAYQANKAQTVYGNNNGTFIQSQALSCPSGYSGSIAQSRYVNVINGSYSYGAWTTTSNSCQPIVLTPQPCPNGYQGYYVLNEISGEPMWRCTPIQTN